MHAWEGSLYYLGLQPNYRETSPELVRVSAGAGGLFGGFAYRKGGALWLKSGRHAALRLSAWKAHYERQILPIEDLVQRSFSSPF